MPLFTLEGTPRMDRKGRTRLRARCNHACTVAVRVSTRLTTGRVIRGRLVKRSARAGRMVDVRLTRPKLPRRRRAASSRLVGTITGNGTKAALNIRLR